jgi:trehalose 6-phosphate synthase
MSGLLVCSHRGPVILRPSKQGVQLEPAGPGGLVVAVSPAVESFGGTWLFSPSSAEEAELAALSPGGITAGSITYRLLDLPEEAHHDHYATISSEILMPLFHYLLPLAERPTFTSRILRAWEGYRLVNSIYGEAVRLHQGADAVLVEDVHLMLVAAAARQKAPGGRLAAPLSYFHHVPWCSPDYFGVLPESIRREILASLLAYDSVGFHCRRWAENFWSCCEYFLPGVSRSGEEIEWEGRATRLVASRVAVDAGRLVRTAGAAQTQEWRDRFAEIRGQRELIVRVERADPSKNTVRGLEAFGALMEQHPRAAGQSCLLVVLTPVRTWIPDYRRYLDQCRATADAINSRFRAGGCPPPVCLHTGGEAHSYDHHRALAALGLAAVTMVTPSYDGCNLVAMEAMLAGDGPSLILSENAGIHAWLGQHAFSVNPFDIPQTVDALGQAIAQPATVRTKRAAAMREIITAHTPRDWVNDRLAGCWQPAASDRHGR